MQTATSSCTTTQSPETSQPDIMISTVTDVEKAEQEQAPPGSEVTHQDEDVAVSEPGGEKGLAPLPKDPYCAFTKNWKLFIVLTVSMAGFFSPFAINIYIPALPQIAGLLNISEGERAVSSMRYSLPDLISPHSGHKYYRHSLHDCAGSLASDLGPFVRRECECECLAMLPPL